MITKISIMLFISVIFHASVYACSCVRMDVGNANSKIQSMGTGYNFSKNGKTVFKFVSCVNRPGCEDLQLPSIKYPANQTVIGNPETIYTRFPSFEQAQKYDIKENKKRDQLRKIKKEKRDDRLIDCSCPIPNVLSITSNARPEEIEEFKKNNPVEFKSEFKGCNTCEKFEELQNLSYGSTAINGKMFLKDEQLFFEAVSKKDSRTFKIAQNFKCAPILKDLVNENIRLYTNYPLELSKDTIDYINMCEVRFSTQQYILETSNYPEEVYKNKIFPTPKNCLPQKYTDKYLENAKTIIFVRHSSKSIRDRVYFFQTTDILNNGRTENIYIKDYKYVQDFEKANKGWHFDFAIISTDKIKIDETLPTKIKNHCNTVFLLEGFTRYPALRRKYSELLNKAQAESRCQELKEQSPFMSEEMLLRICGKRK